MSTSRDPSAVATTTHKPVTWRKIAFWSTAVVLPPAVAILASRRSKLLGGVAGGLTALAIGGLRWQFQRWFADEPSYEIEDHVGPLEIRRYRPHVEARTRVLTDDHDMALETGFRRLAEYIFGHNHRQESLAMTSPVVSQGEPDVSAGEHIEMTSPVINQRGDSGHVMSFVMPPGRDRSSLPTPDDDRIELEEIPARRLAVLTFRGRYNADSVKRHQDELLGAARDAGLHVTGTPLFAGFDPPNTLPWLRRNEVWVEIA